MDSRLYHLTTLSKQILNQFPNINDGGCCVFAALVAQELKEFCDVKVVVFSTSLSNIEDVRPNISNYTCAEWERNGIAFNHIVLEIYAQIIPENPTNVWHYDATGIFSTDRSMNSGRSPVGYLSIAECIELANDPIGWNPTFDRRDIPIIQKIIKNHFSLAPIQKLRIFPN